MPATMIYLNSPVNSVCYTTRSSRTFLRFYDRIMTVKAKWCFQSTLDAQATLLYSTAVDSADWLEPWSICSQCAFSLRCERSANSVELTRSPSHRVLYRSNVVFGCQRVTQVPVQLGEMIASTSRERSTCRVQGLTSDILQPSAQGHGRRSCVLVFGTCGR